MKSVIDKIKPEEALEVLRSLADSDPHLKEKISHIAEDMISNVDINDVCNDVYFQLDGIDVNDLWSRSGSTAGGYCPPEEMAVEMVEEELEPYTEDVNRLLDLKKTAEAKRYCMGVLKGIYKYAHKSKSEFKNWADDIPEECFGYLLEKWTKRSKNKSDIEDMNNFLEKDCKNWAKWAVKKQGAEQ